MDQLLAAYASSDEEPSTSQSRDVPHRSPADAPRVALRPGAYVRVRRKQQASPTEAAGAKRARASDVVADTPVGLQQLWSARLAPTAAAGLECRSWRGQAGDQPTNCVRWAPASLGAAALASASADGVIRLWDCRQAVGRGAGAGGDEEQGPAEDAADGEARPRGRAGSLPLACSIRAHSASVRDCAWTHPAGGAGHAARLLCASYDGTYSVTDVWTGRLLHRATAAAGRAGASGAAPASSLPDWDGLGASGPAGVVTGSSAAVAATAVAAHPTEPSVFAVGLSRGGVAVYDMRTPQSGGSGGSGTARGTTAAACGSAASGLSTVGSGDCAGSGVGLVSQFTSEFDGVQSCLFITDNELCVTASLAARSAMDRGVTVWDWRTGALLSNQPFMEPRSCSALARHPVHDKFVAQTDGGYAAIFSTVRPWKLERRRRFEGHITAGWFVGLSISADGALLGSGCASGQPRLYRWGTSEGLGWSHKGTCSDFQFHPTQPRIAASCGWDGQIVVGAVTACNNFQA